MKQKNIDITLINETDEREVYYDADKLDKILYNLLSNALKYNKEGALVEVHLSYIQDEKYARISVKDNGNGLSESTMKNLFKRFYDGDFRKYNTIGTGIGLSLVKDLITLHKGEINVENYPGKGVCFTIQFPITSADYTNDERNENNQQNDAFLTTDIVEELSDNDTLYNLLVVEDNQDLLLLLKNMLSKRYNIYTATNGKEAIEVMTQEDISLIVSDVMMPEMNGLEATRYIRAFEGKGPGEGTPIIAMTANVFADDVKACLDAGMNSHVGKPLDMKVLIGEILKYTGAR